MLLCAVHAARHGHTKVVLRTVDTDVIVSAISQMQNLYLSIRALVGVWCAGKHYHIIPVLTITIGIGSAKPSALPFYLFHALTECATTPVLLVEEKDCMGDMEHTLRSYINIFSSF